MKIDPKLIEGIDLKKVPERKSVPGTPSAATSSVASGESRVRLSELSSTLHTLEAKLTAEPAFDAGKVQEIKDAIRSGEFRINPEAIADRLIDSVREWVGKP